MEKKETKVEEIKEEETTNPQEIKENDEKSSQEKPKQLEELYDEAKDREFLVKKIIGFEQKIDQLTLSVQKLQSSDFAQSEVKTKKEELKPGYIEIPD